MKLITLLSVLIIFFCLFTSCQKEIDNTVTVTDSTVNTNPTLVKTYGEETVFNDYPEFNTKDSVKITYDSQNRQVSLISLDTSGFKMMYQYGSNSFTLDQTSNDNSPLHEIFYLNSNTLLDSTLQYNEGDTTTEKYVYNANKQLIKLYEYDYTAATGGELSATTSYEYDNEGNLITETTGSTITTYTYTNHSPNTLNVGLTFLTQPKFLPDAYTYTEDGATLSGTHTYTYDSQNRVTSDKETFSGDAGDGYSLKTYTY